MPSLMRSWLKVRRRWLTGWGGVDVQDLGESTDGDGQEGRFAVTSLDANRVHLSSAEEVIGLLSSAGVTKEAMIRGLVEKTIKGLPEL
jgi:hypothetical protein